MLGRKDQTLLYCLTHCSCITGIQIQHCIDQLPSSGLYELLAELINLAGIEACSSDATLAETMKGIIQESLNLFL